MKETETVKALPKLDSLPKEVALVIGESIKAWAELGGTLNERIKKRKWAGVDVPSCLLRLPCLKTLSSAFSPQRKRCYPKSCSSRQQKNYETVSISLLHNVTVSIDYLQSLRTLLERGEEFEEMIKTFHYTAMDFQGSAAMKKLTKTMMDFVQLSTLDLPKTERKHDDQNAVSGISNCLWYVFEKAKNLQVLVVDNTWFDFPFQTRVNGKLNPFKFLSHSLKRIQVILPPDTYDDYSSLQKCRLGFGVLQKSSSS